jgi:hypothetical protein
MSPWRSNFHSPRNYDGRITAVLFPDHDSAVSWSRECCFLITTVLFPYLIPTVLFPDHGSAVSWPGQCCFLIKTVLFPDHEHDSAVSWSRQSCFLITTVLFPDHESLFHDQDSSAVSWSRKCRLLILFSDHCNSVSRTRRCYFRVREEVFSHHSFPITTRSYFCYCFSGHWPIFRLPTTVRFAAFSNWQPDGGVSRVDRVPWKMANLTFKNI